MRDRNDGAFKGETGLPCEIDTKAITEQGEFEGYLSVFGNIDQGGDVVMPGAFTASLQKRPARKVKLLLHHDSRRIAGVWTDLAEDTYGLKAKGQLLLTTQDGRETYEQMKAGALDGLSIGYRTMDDEIDRETRVRRLKALDLLEGSICTFPMNPDSTISAVKSARDYTTQDWREIEAALRDEGLSRADAVKAVSGLKNWFRRDAETPEPAPRDEAASVELHALAARIKALTA